MDGPSERTAPVSGPPWLLGLRQAEAEPPPPGTAAAGDGLPPDTLGLALSGGGIRSAAFCLGVLQAMARGGWLRHVDYLSTVSGGGYIGSFLGRYFDSYRGRRSEPDLAPDAVQGRVARGLSDPDSEPVDWLRRHSNYLAPGGFKDASANFAAFFRNLLSVYVVLGVFLLAVFGSLDAVRYSRLVGSLVSLTGDLIAGLSPLTHQLPTEWQSPWLVLAEFSVWSGSVPLMLAYWVVSRELPEAFIAAVLVAAAIVVAVLTFLTAGPLPLLVLTMAVLWALWAWSASRREEGPVNPLNPYRLMLGHEVLTNWLAFWLTTTVMLLAFAVVDALGLWLARHMIAGGLTTRHVTGWLTSIVVMAVGPTALVRKAVRFAASGLGAAGSLGRFWGQGLWLVAVILFGVAPPLVAVSFVAHASYEAGEAYTMGLAVTIAAVVVSLLLGSREGVPFVNRSGAMGIYAGRLSRAFLGAVNPNRRLHPEGQDVTKSVYGDDVSFAKYHPELAGGPLHLINCALNETIDPASYRTVRDRQAENFAVGPVGASVARDWHAYWAGGGATAGGLRAFDGESPNPFLGQPGALIPAEQLNLEDWVAISGAYVAPGMGQRTGLTRSLIYTLADARLGYWWDSGLEDDERPDAPIKGGWLSGLVARFSRLFRTQWLLFAELTGRYGGPWRRFWYLSDGGYFEITGAYELLRRRVPFLILCDVGEDPQHQGPGLAQLVRIARVDLGAEVTVVPPDPEALRAAGVPAGVSDRIGTLDDLLTPGGGPSLKHAALLRVRYPEPPPGATADPWLGRRLTWALYIKPSVTGDEPADVLNYLASHPDFPNETTLDQLFDEPQWESYRILGNHIGSQLFNMNVSDTP